MAQQTDYDLKGFIDDLRSNKVPEDEIKGYLKNKFGDQTVQIYFPSADAMTIDKPMPSEAEVLTAPVAAGLAAVGTAAATYIGKKIKDRFIGQKKEEPPVKIEPTFGPLQTPTTQTNLEKQLQGMDVQKLPKDQRELVGTLLDAERKRAEKQKQATTLVRQEMKGMIQPPTTMSPGFVPPIITSVPVQLSTPEIPTVADIGKQSLGLAPVAPPATTAQIAAEAVPTVAPTPASEEGKKKGRPTKEAQAKAMEGLTFRSDLGPGDNWLYNSFGAEGRKAILERYNEGKPAGSYENSQQILAKMQQERIAPGRAELPRDIAKERGVPPPETNYGKLGKTAKVAGVAGLALTAQQAAQAQQMNELRRILGEALLPLAATPSELQPGTLGPAQIRAFQEAQKLGSPYRSIQPPQ
jgi:hypothetical protein